MNKQFPYKGWSTPKFAVFGSSSLSLPPLVGGSRDWYASRFVKPFYCQIILTASSPGIC